MYQRKDEKLGEVTLVPMFGGKAKLRKGYVLLAVREKNGKLVTGEYKLSKLSFKVDKDVLREYGYLNGKDNIQEVIKSKFPKGAKVTLIQV